MRFPRKIKKKLKACAAQNGNEIIKVISVCRRPGQPRVFECEMKPIQANETKTTKEAEPEA